MKTSLLLLLIFAFQISFAQITIEKTIPHNKSNETDNSIYLINLSNNDYIYLKTYTAYTNITRTNICLRFYNPDFSIYKTVEFPFDEYEIWQNYNDITNQNGINPELISNKLYNDDPKVEFLLATRRTPDNYPPNLYIVNEDGEFIQTIDSVSSAKIFTNNSIKQLVLSRPSGFFFYNLNNTISSTSAKSKTSNSILSDPYPNPSSDITTINFELPTGINTAELKIIDSQGKVLKNLTVDNTFGYVKINTHEFKPGNYYYSLYTQDGEINTKKMIVIK